MLLALRHVTVLDYAAPVAAAIQYLRLRPRSDGGQRVLRWNVSVPGRMHPWRDCHGNLVDTLVIDRPTAKVEVVAEGEIDTATAPRPVDVGLPSGAYLRGTALTSAHTELAAFAREHASAGPDALAGMIRGVMRRCAPGSPVTAGEAFAAGAGSAVDMAHVLIACCRSLGVPARFVSGYVDDHGGASVHAWAEVLTSDGWIGYDPSRGARVGLGHVVLAIGLDHDDTGIAVGPHRTGGSDRVTLGVRVGQRQQ